MLLIITLAMGSISWAKSCTCTEGKGKFGDCKLKNPSAVWGNHYDQDIGLHTDCLPQVPEKYVCIQYC